MFTVGMRAHDIGKLPIAELIAKLKQLNVTNIQFAPTKAVSDIDFAYGNFSPGLAAYLGKKFLENGIRISVFGSYLDPTNLDEQKRAKTISAYIENLKYTKFIGADMAGTETGDINRFTSAEAAYQVLLSSIRQIVNAAEKLGVIFGVEGVVSHTLTCAKTLRRLLDDINSPNLCVIFDPCNLLSDETAHDHYKTVEEMLTLCGNEISAIHLKDFTIIDGKKTLVPIGQGMFDFEQFFTWLKRCKPAINMMIEGSTFESFASEREFLCNIYEKV